VDGPEADLRPHARQRADRDRVATFVKWLRDEGQSCAEEGLAGSSDIPEDRVTDGHSLA
jgi:hypothetical protein